MEIVAFSPALAELLALDAQLERVATGFQFTEGPLWHPEEAALYFSDIPASRIYRWRPEQGQEADAVSVYREPSGKSNGLTWDRNGRLLACEHLGRRVSQTLSDGTAEDLAVRYGGRRLNSPNDLVCKSDGTVYFTDPPYGILNAEQGALAEQEQPVNGLYLVRPGDEPVLLAGDFERPNGLAFSPDERLLYVNDTPRYHTRVFAVTEDGTLEGGEVFAEYAAERGQGRPDGLKVTQAGHVVTTGPGGLWIVAPGGELLGHVGLPEKGTNCAWGDADLQSLYVTAGVSVYRLRFQVPSISAFPE